MRLILKLFLFGFILIIAYLLFYPVPIDPVKYIASENPGMTGPYAQNNALSNAEILLQNVGTGPEDVARGPDGFYYTGLLDGRIIKFNPENNDSETFVNTGGRPAGMGFASNGNLIVADGIKGLLSITPQKTISVLTDSVNGKRMLLVDDLDIAKDGTIWFSDASQRFDLHHLNLDAMEARQTGRLLSYNPATKETVVHVENLFFANGVALGPNEEFVLVNETLAARITRLWLKGEKAGQKDLFLSNLPAYVDNISFNGKDIFWVALVSPRMKFIEDLWRYPFLRKVLMRLPDKILEAPSPQYGWVIGLNTDGEVIHNFQDPSGKLHEITSVNEYNGSIYLGSYVAPFVGRYELPQ